MNALADAAGITLGPSGRSVILPGASAPRLSRDGVAVAIEIELPHRLQNLGAELLRTVASQTVSRVGDGTTSAIVLGRAMAVEVVRLLAAGCNPLELRRGLVEALAVAHRELAAQARPMSEAEVMRVAELSAGGDETAAAHLSRAFAEVGQDGLIAIEAGKSAETTLELQHGARFERGLLSPYFITDPERAECVLIDARVLLSHAPLSELGPLLPILEAIRESNQALLVVAEDVVGDALSALVVNRLRTNLCCAAVRAPGFGVGRREHLRDLAALTSATLLGDDSGPSLQRVTLEHLGKVERANISATSTTLLGGAGAPDAVRSRLLAAERDLTSALSDSTKSDSERSALKARVRQLATRAAIVHVGARSELELQDRKDRLEDALSALRTAFADGLVPGGGVALLRCERAVSELAAGSADHAAGHGIVRRALSAPLRRLLLNAGYDAEAVVARVRAASGAFGFDVLAGEHVDLARAGILDPLGVVKSELECAGRVATLLLTTGASLVGAEPSFDDFRDV